jgi:hypothetical protein
MDDIITIVIIHYVIRRSFIGHANISLEQSFHMPFIYLYIYKYDT